MDEEKTGSEKEVAIQVPWRTFSRSSIKDLLESNNATTVKEERIQQTICVTIIT